MKVQTIHGVRIYDSHDAEAHAEREMDTLASTWNGET